ncbi:zinc metalloproteinase-disintegrin-like VMP-III isoform X2 [Biomphalaria glabrata]|uniref:Zinc metalloproteinase-disintegrin-like VMP-III isoform X2 n=1 Tax=Biomphalaria glabrata TaxID=6526 RepID=A0A9W3BIW5_BIOGL|nr:zinc metalloproteinase-disintegrin-like VMP-III isoform X2 [Biomphalaria glabrata]
MIVLHLCYPLALVTRMMERHLTVLLLVVALLHFGLVTGSLVLIKLANVDISHTSLDGGCSLPYDLDIELSSLSGQESKEGLHDLPRRIRLVQNDARHTVRQVHVIQQGSSGRFYLETVPVETLQNENVQRYYNHHHGMILTVGCSWNGDNGFKYTLEGSFFVKGIKYLLKHPSSLLFEDLRDTVTSVHELDRSQEHNAEDSAWKRDLPSTSEEYTAWSLSDQTLTREKRETSTVYHIDVLPVVDVSIYRKFLINRNDSEAIKAITNYIANILTSVNMRLETLSLEGIRLKVHLLEPHISKGDNTSVWNNNILESNNNEVSINATKLLASFKDWLNTKSSEILKYDHAFLLTAYNIYGGNDQGIRFNITKGLAYVSSICNTNGESSSIIEDKGGYQSEGVLAHELGHSLGSTHDGERNNCSSRDRFLMSDSNYDANSLNVLNPWKFSACSSAAILIKLRALETNTTVLNTCLKNQTGKDVNNLTTVDANDQCQSLYGNASFACRGLSFGNISSFCQDFYCRIPSRESCERVTPATGTCCGNKKKCNKGECQDAATGECPMDDECPLGDQPGPIINGQTCSTAHPANCYTTDFRLKCCNTCSKIKSNNENCQYGDKRSGCNTTYCGQNTTDGHSYNFFCCKTCNNHATADATKLEYKGTIYSCSGYVNLLTGSVCNSVTIQDACPITCEQFRNKENPDCPWGDKNNCSVLANDLARTGSTCPALNVFNCCRTCAEANTTSATTTKTVASTTTTKLSTATTKAPASKTCKSPCAACSVFHFLTSSSVMSLCFLLRTILH